MNPEWLVTQRWFAAKAKEVTGVEVLEEVQIAGHLRLAIVEARFQTGTHELYQVPLLAGDEDDALADPAACAALLAQVQEGGRIGAVEFSWTGALDPWAPDGTDARPMGAEQSNSSIVFGERLVMKVFRRLEPGDNPELELLRFLTARRFEHIATLGGWYELEGATLDSTLGVVQRFVPGGQDAWELAVEGRLDGPAIEDLGAVTGRLHSCLASDPSDHAFAPEEPSLEGLSLLTAEIDEQIERAFVDLPHDDEHVAPIAGRGEELRDRLQLMSHVGVGGRTIRTHGDFHLGQCLLEPSGHWVLLDFEGEPARTLIERRRKRSPLRDVAGMLRSFAYAQAAAELQHSAPLDAGWEVAARERFLTGYLGAVEPSLLPAGRAATDKLLSIFELEKAVYELRYELNNRPDWVQIPVRAIARLLDGEGL